MSVGALLFSQDDILDAAIGAAYHDLALAGDGDGLAGADGAADRVRPSTRAGAAAARLGGRDDCGRGRVNVAAALRAVIHANTRLDGRDLAGRAFGRDDLGHSCGSSCAVGRLPASVGVSYSVSAARAAPLRIR